MSKTAHRILGYGLAAVLGSETVSLAAAKAFNGQTGMDQVRLGACMALPGMGNDGLRIGETAAIIVGGQGPQDCEAVLKRSGLDLK